METKAPKTPTISELADQHLQLLELVQDISDKLKHRRVSQAKILAMLSHLHDEVLDHFQFEEAGGYFSQATELAPRLTEHADMLLKQHPALAAQLAKVEETAQQDAPSDAWWQTLAGEFEEFVGQFHAHEHAETALLQEAFNRAIGTDD